MEKIYITLFLSFALYSIIYCEPSSSDQINTIFNSYQNNIEKKFEEDFEKARKNSIFEWRITSMTIVDRKDLKNFEEAKNNCPNRLP